jgi:hypothetical protein
MPQPSKPKPLDNQAILVMSLLALQFGIQPILTKRYTPPTVCKSTVILCQEVVKFALAAFMLHMSGGGKAALDGKLRCDEDLTVERDDLVSPTLAPDSH